MKNEDTAKKAAEARKAYNRDNIRTLGTNVKKEEAEAFRKLAEDQGLAPGALLRGYIRAALSETPTPKELTGHEHIVSYRNTDRLKRETAHYNPKGLNPDGMLNDILDRYFDFVEAARMKSRD